MKADDSNVSIQEITKEDQSEFYNLIDKNRENLRLHLGWIDKTQKESDLDNWFVKGEELHRKKEGCNLKIFLNNSIIGFIGIFINDEEKRVFELGYWLDIDWRNQGITSSLIPAIEEICFNEFDAGKVEIRCAAGNLSSDRIAQKNDYKFERIIENYRKIAGVDLDYNVYGKIAKIGLIER